eukprot:06265.XXX_279700_280160_1 [CDS] Oithona nana genome sequencing.
MGILLLMLTKPSTGIWCRTCDKCDPGTNWGHKYCPERNVCGLDVSNHDRTTAKQYCMNGDFLPPLTIGCHIFYDEEGVVMERCFCDDQNGCNSSSGLKVGLTWLITSIIWLSIN